MPLLAGEMRVNNTNSSIETMLRPELVVMNEGKGEQCTSPFNRRYRNSLREHYQASIESQTDKLKKYEQLAEELRN